MNEWLNITYCGMHDKPLMFFVELGAKCFLFERDFDEAQEEYENEYRIHKMPNNFIIPEPGNWSEMVDKAEQFIGVVPIGNIELDKTRRKQASAKSIIEAINL